ncbi:hypothetical protein K461DRAFT_143251 [Myriangium duriaei CBS 260.36]|uniref:Uncharacterized protein n=1 Tax=Myriangium duriaei CBS 260.36 TaxID=1168546 RepID=A0A9P4J2S0_9PEZI|nr:hypothetical protein K461DRAFT_143251 [Myriangium duriaei CBS 260.36]
MATDNESSLDWLSGDSEAILFATTHDLFAEAHRWGFLVFRTTTDSTSSNDWDDALEVLYDFVAFSITYERLTIDENADEGVEELILSKFDLTVVYDPGLKGADDRVIRAYFREWESCNSRRPALDSIALTLDDNAVLSLVSCPRPQADIEELDDNFGYVRVVDMDYDETSSEAVPHYKGWMLCKADALVDLYSMIHMQKMRALAPEIEKHGQIPLYIGDGYIGQLIDPSEREWPQFKAVAAGPESD